MMALLSALAFARPAVAPAIDKLQDSFGASSIDPARCTVSHSPGTATESGGKVFWDTSTDGAVYSAQASVSTSTLFAISSLKTNFYLETFNGGLANPGQASFASFNVAPTGIQPVSSLIDAFDGSSLGSSW